MRSAARGSETRWSSSLFGGVEPVGADLFVGTLGQDGGFLGLAALQQHVGEADAVEGEPGRVGIGAGLDGGDDGSAFGFCGFVVAASDEGLGQVAAGLEQRLVAGLHEGAVDLQRAPPRRTGSPLGYAAPVVACRAKNSEMIAATRVGSSMNGQCPAPSMTCSSAAAKSAAVGSA